MIRLALLAAVLAALSIAQPVWAADCYADYKAKQDNPLRLHYGVIALNGPCQRGAARSEVSQRLAAAGWTLLNVVSVFGPDGLDSRRADAGAYFLRF